MTYTHLVSKKSKSSIHFHFRSIIPKDLISYFNEKTVFQISLIGVRNGESLLLSLRLNRIVIQLYSDIRSGMKNLTLEDIKEILRIEVRKSILHRNIFTGQMVSGGGLTDLILRCLFFWFDFWCSSFEEGISVAFDGSKILIF